MTAEESSIKLANGFLSMYEPDLKKLQNQLNELTTKQTVILKQIEEENKKFNELKANELNSMFTMVREYQLRLMNVKQEMFLLTERSAKLKKRALRLQEFKQREALENAHYRESQLKREQDLIAKPNSNINTF